MGEKNIGLYIYIYLFMGYIKNEPLSKWDAHPSTG